MPNKWKTESSWVSKHMGGMMKSPLKKYIGFNKLSKKIQGEGKSKEAADAIAASIGRKKYGSKGFNTKKHG